MRRLIVFGIALYALFLLRQFPADVAVNWAAPDTITVYGARGTVWSGEADAIDTGLPGLLLGATRWDIGPLWLLTGRVRGQLNSRFQDSAVQTGFSKGLIGSGLALYDTNAILTLDTLPPNLLPQPAKGRVGLSFDNLRLNDLWPTDAKGSVDLVDLEVVQGRRVTLGSFEILFDGTRDAERGVIGNVADTDSTLSVNGTLSLAADRSYLFEGVAKASDRTPPDIAQALQFLGTPEPDGSVEMSFSGTVE